MEDPDAKSDIASASAVAGERHGAVHPDHNGGPYFKFRQEWRVVRGRMSDIRSGTIRFDDGCLEIKGRRALTWWVQIPVLCAIAILPVPDRPLAFAVIWAILEFGFRRRTTVLVPFQNIVEVVANQEQRRCGIVFTNASIGTAPRAYSLVFRLAPQRLQAFISAVAEQLPGRLREGTMPYWPPIIGVAVVLAVVVVQILIMLIIGSSFVGTGQEG